MSIVQVMTPRLFGASLPVFAHHFQNIQIGKGTSRCHNNDDASVASFYVPFMINRRLRRVFFASDAALETFVFSDTRVTLRTRDSTIGHLDLGLVRSFGFLPLRHRHLALVDAFSPTTADEAITHGYDSHLLTISGRTPHQMGLAVVNALRDSLTQLTCAVTFLDQPELPSLRLETLKCTAPARHGGLVACLRQRPKRLDFTDYEDFALNAIFSIQEAEVQESVRIVALRLVRDTGRQTVQNVLTTLSAVCPNLETVEIEVNDVELAYQIRNFIIPEYFHNFYGTVTLNLKFKISLECDYEWCLTSLRDSNQRVRLGDPLMIANMDIPDLVRSEILSLPDKARRYVICQKKSNWTAVTQVDVRVPEFCRPDLVDVHPEIVGSRAGLHSSQPELNHLRY